MHKLIKIVVWSVVVTVIVFFTVTTFAALAAGEDGNC